MFEDALIGVDEAGRAPLAGPVSVGTVAVPPGFDVKREFNGVTDSKLMSAAKREVVYEEVLRRAHLGDVRFVVKFSSHGYIDRFGITRAVRKAAWEGIRQMAHSSEAAVMLDGLLRAPKSYMQRTIIAGDLRVPVISLASVVAKVERDRLMRNMDALYPGYGFESHKGYATPAHYRALRELGLCDIHRRTYCKIGKNTVEFAAR